MNRIRNNDFKLKLKEGSIRDYEKIVLSQINDIFMPMGFVSTGEGELVSYNCSGYAALRQCRITEVMEALEILERTLILVRRAGEYLITPRKIMLSVDTIFYNRESRQVKIAYVPVENENATLRENMTHFITEMESNVTGAGKAYLQDVKKEMDENNYYIHDLINVIGEIRRSASAKQVQLEEVFS